MEKADVYSEKMMPLFFLKRTPILYCSPFNADAIRKNLTLDFSFQPY